MDLHFSLVIKTPRVLCFCTHAPYINPAKQSFGQCRHASRDGDLLTVQSDGKFLP